MCGINGILRRRPDAAPIDRDEVLATREAMAARGPDGAGLWMSPGGEVAIASRRLAILDLSPAGDQPMASADGRYHLVFNGEIFNFAELRGELEREGCRFASRSDTEVILTLYARRGPGMLPQLRGMYALAIWDGVERSLLLARDPYGIKPLYYAESGGQLRFASQVKALERGGAIPLDVDPAAVGAYLLWGSVPEPFTIRRSVRALPAGHYLKLEGAGAREPVAFHRFRADEAGDGRDVATALRESVRDHLVSDVPIALFLSAGLDSALVGALAARQAAEPPVSFTLTFDEFVGTPLDEGPTARLVAAALGTRHVERRVRGGEFRELWPEMIRAMDQPSIDGFNTFVVSRLARESGLKVALSGLGGDEVFGGYRSFAQVPSLVRAGRVLRHGPGIWKGAASRWGRHPKLAGVPAYATSIPKAYLLRRGLFLPEELPSALGAGLAADALARYDPLAALSAMLEGYGAPDGGADGWVAVHVLESLQYMRNQLLRDSDWASMANSLELRVPLVDVRLRAALARHGFEPARSRGKRGVLQEAAPGLPAALGKRRKTGFMMPVLRWVTGTPPGGLLDHWGWQSRVLALKVLAEFGIACDAGALPPELRRLVDARPAAGPRPAPPPTSGGSANGRPILVLVPNIRDGHGGIAAHSRALVKALAPLARRHGSAVEVLALADAVNGSGGSPLEAGGTTCQGFGRSRLRFALQAFRKGRRAGLVIVGHVNFAPLVLLDRSKAFLVVYGIDAWRRFGPLWRHALRRFERILSISAFTRNSMATLNGLSADRFTVLPCVLDAPRATEDGPGRRQDLGLPEGPLLLSVSRLDPRERYKGIVDVIETLPLLLKDWPTLSYLVVGEGEDRANLERLAADRGVQDRVRFAGEVPDARLDSYYRSADVFVLPSAAEGFGIVFLEAMSRGRPCVGGAAGGTPEIVAEGRSGFLVSPGNRAELAARLGQLLGDAGLRRRMGEAGRRIVEGSHTLRNMSERLEEILWP
jgi:asparagine synthase (glutamine-hydrolysing)